MKIDLFGMTGESWNDSISAAECINFIPDLSKDKTKLSLRRKNGTLFQSSITAGGEIHEIYGVYSTATSFYSRYYVIYVSAGTYYLAVKYWNGTAWSANDTLGTLTGASGSFSNMIHNATKSGGKVVFADRGANTIWVVTMANNASTDAIASYTMPTGWEIQYFDYQDGFFFGNIIDSGTNNEQRKVVFSDFGTHTFTSTNYYERTSGAGNILRTISDNREIWILCDNAIEVLYNSGNSGVSFTRNTSIYIDTGLYAIDSLVKYDDQLFFIGYSSVGGMAIYKTNGYQLIDITPELLKSNFTGDNFLQIRKAKARGIKYALNDSYIINFGDSTLGTWVYNRVTELWSKDETGSLGFSQYVYGSTYAIVQTATSENGLYLLVPYKSIDSNYDVTNDIYIHYHAFTLATYGAESIDNDAGFYECNPSAISKHIYGKDNKQLIHRRVELEFAGSDGNLIVTLSYSDDDGSTWTSAGALTQSSAIKFRWNALGSSEDRIYKIEVNYATPASAYESTLISAWVLLEQLDS